MRQLSPVTIGAAPLSKNWLPLEGLAALAIWVVLNALDALLTWHSFGIGGAEGNPLLVTVQRTVGPQTMLLSKVLLATGAGALVWWWGKKRLLHAINWLMLVVLTYNFAVVGYILLA